MNVLATDNTSSPQEPVPPYSVTVEDDQTLPAYNELPSEFYKRLQGLDADSSLPTTEQCLVHLKLLHCFQKLRINVSKTDGLFGFWDKDVIDAISEGSKLDPASRALLQQTLLHKLAEKRWATHVAISTVRFIGWWDSIKAKYGTNGLRIQDMLTERSYEDLAKTSFEKSLIQDASDLPPLDVLLVWYSFMLHSPRCYLEDCLRNGMMRLWHTGMPWVALNSCTSLESGAYDPGEEAKTKFEASTARKWTVLADDSEKVSIRCPHAHCATRLRVKYTSLDKSHISRWARQCVQRGIEDISAGGGFCEADFEVNCASCREKINHENLATTKFMADWKKLRLSSTPEQSPLMRGTELNVDGTAKKAESVQDARYFVNELLRVVPCWSQYSMYEISRDLDRILADRAFRKKLQPANRGSVPKDAQALIDRMMSRYKNNCSPYALNLADAVISQGYVVESIVELFPSLPAIQPLFGARPKVKYERFMGMKRRFPELVAIPTFEIDLAWRTHQASPSKYYRYSTSVCSGKFVECNQHARPSEFERAFQETSRVYQEMYKEGYSE